MIKSALEKVISEDLAEIWSILNGDEKRRIIDNFQIHNFKKNQVIYAEKEEPEFIWCLIKGKVKKYKDGIGGRQQIIRLIRPVQYFGYRAYFAKEPYVSSAAALEASTLGTLPMSLVDELINNNIKLGSMGHELHHKIKQLKDITKDLGKELNLNINNILEA